jgi:hypothetical protein
LRLKDSLLREKSNGQRAQKGLGIQACVTEKCTCQRRLNINIEAMQIRCRETDDAHFFVKQQDYNKVRLWVRR